MAYDEDLSDGVDDEERHEEEYAEGGVEEAENTWPDDSDIDKEADPFDPKFFDSENAGTSLKQDGGHHHEGRTAYDDGLNEADHPSDPFA